MIWFCILVWMFFKSATGEGWYWFIGAVILCFIEVGYTRPAQERARAERQRRDL